MLLLVWFQAVSEMINIFDEEVNEIQKFQPPPDQYLVSCIIKIYIFS